MEVLLSLLGIELEQQCATHYALMSACVDKIVGFSLEAKSASAKMIARLIISNKTYESNIGVTLLAIIDGRAILPGENGRSYARLSDEINLAMGQGGGKEAFEASVGAHHHISLC